MLTPYSMVMCRGESGAGKTVSAKFVMNYITKVSGGGQDVQVIIWEFLAYQLPLLLLLLLACQRYYSPIQSIAGSIRKCQNHSKR